MQLNYHRHLRIPSPDDTICPLSAQPDFTRDDTLIAALRMGDEAAFAYLVDHYHATLVRVAMLYCRDQHAAEEVAQETWLALLKGINQFEARSSLKTWLFSILANKAKTRGQRDSRAVTFTELSATQGDHATEPDDDSVVDAARFSPDGWWTESGHPHDWQVTPEAAYQSTEIRNCIQRSIATLPANQQQVMILRDLEGLEAESVCNIMGISETNQRVLLHRARAKVRNALESYFGKP